MRFLLLSLVTFFYSSTAFAQMTDTTELPYQQIPDYPADYSPGNILARMIDGLGFRYYWATEGLTDTDLAFTPSEGSRSTQETLVHIYGLSETIVNAPQNQPNIRPANHSNLSFDTLRYRTLANLKQASELCQGKSADEVAELTIVFQREERSSQFPYWNMINGPIADAIYHTGQIVVFRRTSGNPINSKVNVFLGRTDF
ncbi:DinB family protein [Tunicatimonas pelagia]|uniref:DinB family protein n=1 Tax=Tunicatimonas pelagia TaxID=931531 RepID=UPI002665B5EF|nr:hypothetical protein [Tunicatimonas pelagia]WKN43792.1 hypothetical protein P0M28_02255 [Tunicatimonas pelagia]